MKLKILAAILAPAALILATVTPASAAVDPITVTVSAVDTGTVLITPSPLAPGDVLTLIGQPGSCTVASVAPDGTQYAVTCAAPFSPSLSPLTGDIADFHFTY
jgi:hypothetical protein